jgi:FKBP-type peptidyl-prolyl cis-trans isomerase FkpA
MRPIYFLTLIVIVFTSCGKLDYKKSPSGLVYKIFGNGKDSLIRNGNFIKFHIENRVNDSIYRSTFGGTPAYVQASYSGEKYDISELWTKMRKGDSVIILQSLDTFLKRGVPLPAEIKKGDRLIVTLKIVDVFTSDSAAQADQKKYQVAQAATEKEELKKYFKEKNIEGLQETASGAYVKIINPGTGVLVDSGKYVSVMYKGTSWSGKIFDTNMDTSFHHTEPLSFTVNVDPMIQGFVEGLKLLHNGAEAIFYIPSSLGYGANGRPPNIKPNENLIFNIKVVDVKDNAPEQTSMPNSPRPDTIRKR